MQIVVNVHKAVVRFGFMHMVATNVCVWIASTVAETQVDFLVTFRKTRDEGQSNLPIREHGASSNSSHSHSRITSNVTLGMLSSCQLRSFTCVL